MWIFWSTLRKTSKSKGQWFPSIRAAWKLWDIAITRESKLMVIGGILILAALVFAWFTK